MMSNNWIFLILLSSIHAVARVDGYICPNKISQCDDSYTCCQLLDGSYGCCPYTNAVCCQDKIHCCPFDHTCDDKTQICKNRYLSFTSIPFTKILPSTKVIDDSVNEITSEITNERRTNGKCADGTKCSNHFTCCELEKKGTFGCCQYINATCCSDKLHCCPVNMICHMEKGKCISQHLDVELPAMSLKTNSLTRPEPIIEELKAVAKPSREDGKCDDGFNCPSQFTCCEMQKKGAFGCCPYNDAICCNDRVHCCPKNTRCSRWNGTCESWVKNVDVPAFSMETGMLSNSLEIKQEVKVDELCSDGSACQNGTCANGSFCLKEVCPNGGVCAGMTCCPAKEKGQYDCCPAENGSCCPDKLHCCINGFTCTSDNTCIKSKEITKKLTMPATPLKRTPSNLQQDSPKISVEKSSIDYLLQLIMRKLKEKCKDGLVCKGGTCCPFERKGHFGCCPAKHGSCCPDMEHCCLDGFVCTQENTCQKKYKDSEILSIPAIPMIKKQTVESDSFDQFSDVKVNGLCSDGSACQNGTCANGSFCLKEVCPNGGVCAGMTCCPAKEKGLYDCCPAENGSCCPDKLHCCINGFTCTSDNTCIKKNENEIISIPAIPMIKKQTVESDSFDQFSEEETIVMVKKKVIHQNPPFTTCPDGSFCPKMNTCCVMNGGTFGCCPMNKATCCPDKQSCCPHGYKCVEPHSCSAGGFLIPRSKNFLSAP